MERWTPLAPVLQYLWQNNISTDSCCEKMEEDRDEALITFDTAADARHFLDLVVDDQLAERVLHGLSWDFVGQPYRTENRGLGSGWELEVPLYFPRSDLPALAPRHDEAS